MTPLPHQPNPSAQPISTFTIANPPNPPLDMPTRLLLQLSQTVTQLASRIEGVESRGAQRPLFSGYGHRPSPFTPRVQMDKQPPGTKPLKVDKYKGTGHPHLHLETFFSLCSSTGYTDAMACQAFQETIFDEALSWFLNLPPNSIDNFDQLSERFLSRFILHASIYRSYLEICLGDATTPVKLYMRNS
ncbi:hypothetical protein ACLB2K_050833 [Fragaria x ananassa]